jgi:hypothetical protein
MRNTMGYYKWILSRSSTGLSLKLLRPPLQLNAIAFWQNDASLPFTNNLVLKIRDVTNFRNPTC